MVAFDEQGFALQSGEIICHCCYPSGAYIGPQSVYVSIHTGLPAHAYLDAPPQHEPGVWPSRINRNAPWTLQPDHRGKLAYNIQSKVEREVTELGPLPEQETLLKPASSYDKWDGSQWISDIDAEAAATLATATTQRNVLLTDANQKIAVLGDAIELGMATDAEQAAYTAWRRYRVELTRLDLAASPINWPQQPA